MRGALLLPIIYLLVFALYLAVPGPIVEGYVRGPHGHLLRYRLNGLRVLLITLGLYFAACHYGLIGWDELYLERWTTLSAAFVIGVAFTLVIVLTAPPVAGQGLPAALFLGRRENPQALGGLVDAKMFLYLIGATMLALNILSFGAHQRLIHGAIAPSVVLYTGLFFFFLCEYLFFERVHLYTYDFVAERVGGKLGWGCLVFYPFFYAVGLWSVADRPDPGSHPALLVLSAALFFGGWSLSRGANLQKFHFKQDPTRPFLGMTPVALEHEGRRVLISGYWGLSRHINYLGEILMATGLCLSLGYPTAIGPWLYPLYYVALLFPRQADDDRRCAAKYGPLWKTYVDKVPYRIIPRVY